MELIKCIIFSTEGAWFDSELHTTENCDMDWQLRDHRTEYKWREVGIAAVNYGPTVGFVLRQIALRQVSIIPDSFRAFNPQWPLEIFLWLLLSVSFHYSSPALWPFPCGMRNAKIEAKWNQEQPMKVNVVTLLVHLLFPWDCKFHFQHCFAFHKRVRSWKWKVKPVPVLEHKGWGWGMTSTIAALLKQLVVMYDASRPNRLCSVKLWSCSEESIK